MNGQSEWEAAKAAAKRMAEDQLRLIADASATRKAKAEEVAKADAAIAAGHRRMLRALIILVVIQGAWLAFLLYSLFV